MNQNYLRSAILTPLALLLSPLTSLAWDDEDFDAPSRSSRSQSSYSLHSSKNLLQDANPDLIQPSKPLSQTETSFSTRPLRLETVDQAHERRGQKSAELMAESQRSFERQEADQQRGRAQMAKQQEIYHEMDREECEMAEFLGGVYKAKFGATTGRNSAVTTEGYVYRSGDNFVTPRGIYTKTGNTYAGPGSFTTQTGTLFFGNKGTTIQAGGAYFTEGESGFIVAPNCRNTSTWRSR